MDRRKITNAKPGTVAVPVLSIIIPRGILAVLPWELVTLDSRIHKPANHIYSFLLKVPMKKLLYKYIKEVFTVGCGVLESGKVYECMLEERYGIWCNMKDYEIIKKMESKYFGFLEIIYGLYSPFDVVDSKYAHTPNTMLDGYEINWHYN